MGRLTGFGGIEEQGMNKDSRVMLGVLAGTLAGLFLAGAALAQTASYQGKTVRMIIPSGAGGGYDTYARVLTAHLANHLPGKPTIVNQNMPGASGMIAINWAASDNAPKDGSVLVATYNALLLEPLFDNPLAKYDPRKFEWIGSIGKQQQICLTWHTSPIKSIEQAKEREVVVSATGATGNTATIPKMLNMLLGTKFKVVTGYTTTESRLAVERGEAEGSCGHSYSTLKATNPDWIINKRINVLIQTGATAQQGLENVPLLINLVSDPDEKKMLGLLAYPEEMGRPFLMPPGTPKPYVEAMRKAFDETMKDPAFLADAERARLEVEPVSGTEMEKMIKAAFETPKALVERASQFKGE
jgi:tripartite-type tricarboxylate transporter receptor subunit TctC